jgi:hypothetical protein
MTAGETGKSEWRVRRVVDVNLVNPRSERTGSSQMDKQILIVGEGWFLDNYMQINWYLCSMVGIRVSEAVATSRLPKNMERGWRKAG